MAVQAIVCGFRWRTWRGSGSRGVHRNPVLAVPPSLIDMLVCHLQACPGLDWRQAAPAPCPLADNSRDLLAQNPTGERALKAGAAAPSRPLFFPERPSFLIQVLLFRWGWLHAKQLG
jgi:hypothetical protein